MSVGPGQGEYLINGRPIRFRPVVDPTHSTAGLAHALSTALQQHTYRLAKATMRLISTLRNLFLLPWREAAKFGVIGGVCWFIDNGIYALLWHGPMSESTIKARVVSTAIATLCSWFANRYWAFSSRRSDRPWKEFILFLAMNGIGLGIVIACQFVSRYVLGVHFV